jgi:dTMP kinase
MNKDLEDVRREENFQKYFHYTREPGGTDVGEKIRGLLLNDVMYPFSEMCLFSAQRMEVRKSVVEKQLFNGVNVLSDRAESSTFAYQIRGRNLGHLEELFWELNRHLAPFPTLYIFLDLDPKVAASRLKRRETDVPGDRFDREEIEFFEKVRKGFLDFSQKVDVPCKYVNAEQSPESLLADVVAIISNHLGMVSQSFHENVISLDSVKRV